MERAYDSSSVSASAGTTSSASLFFGLFTRALTGYASTQSSGAGASNASSAATSWWAGSSHSSHDASSSTTGMRSWIGASTVFARVVMIAHERTHASGASRSATSALRQISHNPANASG